MRRSREQQRMCCAKVLAQEPGSPRAAILDNEKVSEEFQRMFIGSFTFKCAQNHWNLYFCFFLPRSINVTEYGWPLVVRDMSK